MENLRNKSLSVIKEIDKVILGKHTVVEEVLLAILSNGHILLEDIPGVGKTTLALGFSKALGLDYKRVQCTPDVLPSDLTGFYMYNRKLDDFTFQKGSVFCNLVLADEINRASPKTQSALLEVMEERHVTVDGNTMEVPKPFIVIATQNFMDSAGTQRLPDTQLDRFSISLNIGYPDFKDEIEMLRTTSLDGRVKNLNPIINRENLLQIQKEVSEIYVSDEIYEYIVTLIRNTRENKLIKQGGSPRATIALLNISRAKAWLSGREFVIPNDVEEQFKYVISHRIVLNANAKIAEKGKDTVIQEILANVKKPTIGKK